MPDSGSSQMVHLTKELLLEIGGWRAMKEGRSLYEAGRVSDIKLEGSLLSGVVRSGTSTVNARLRLGKRISDIENLCSCRQAREYGTICAHVIALGLKYIEWRDRWREGGTSGGGAVPMPEVAQLAVIPVSEAASSSRILEVRVLLPLNFSEAWKRGEMRILCEGSVDGGPFQPLDALARAPVEAYAVYDSDANLLELMTKWCGGNAVGQWILTADRFGTFFDTLVGHPRVMQGKRNGVSVQALATKPRLFLSLRDSGELCLHLEEPERPLGTLLYSSDGQWVFDGEKLIRVNHLRKAYQWLQHRDQIIPRDQLAHFFRNEVAQLGREVELILDDRCESLKFEPIVPQIRVCLDGMMSGLSCRVEAIYHGHVYVLKGGGAASEVIDELWVPDPNDPLRYHTRHVAFENAVIRELIASGFEPGRRHPELYTLTSEKRVGAFLANDLPAWRRRWQVEFSARLERLMAECECIQPEVTVTEHQSSGENWLEMWVDYRASSGDLVLSPSEVQRLLQTGLSHTRLASGKLVLLPTQAVSDFQQVIYDCAARQVDGHLRVDRRYSAYLHEALQGGDWRLTERSRWTPPARIESFEDVPLSPRLEKLLRPYQRQGVAWLHHLARNGLAGILADEMGLGKTLQTLAYLEFRRRQCQEPLPALIICPTSLVQNWKSEAERFTPELSTQVVNGPQRSSLLATMMRYDVVVTSYALLRRDVKHYQKVKFDTVVLDEAQFIKNRFSQNAQCAKSLSSNYRIILTGTPIENFLSDLWSMFDFLMPSYLGPASEFKQRYEVPITKNGDSRAQLRLNQRIRPFVLRRTKSQVIKDLPPKLEQIAYCELSDEQKAVYAQILEVGRRQVFEGNGQKEGSRSRIAVLTLLTRLRQVCCHLGMLPTEPGQTSRTWHEPSAKMDYCFDLLDQTVIGGHRVLIFSQFVRLLKLIQERLEASGISYCYLDGSTTDRAREVERFQNDSSIPVFLISLKAGGTGLNLSGADTVIHFDPWWNPAVEDQATARVHRIGQTRVVNSYKLIAKGTVEEKIVNLQERKKDVAANTLVSEEAFVRSLSWDDLRHLIDPS